MAKWGFDQDAAEIWMEQNFEDTGSNQTPRVPPLAHEVCLSKVKSGHERIESKLSDKSVPQELSSWLT